MALKFKLFLLAAAMVLVNTACGGSHHSSAIPPAPTPTPMPTPIPTARIKHLIVVIGENHSFDNLFATYVPSNPTQQVWNLLSQGIVNQNGQAGPNFSAASQNQATDTVTYESSPRQTGPFPALPQPSTTLNALPASPCELSKFIQGLGQDPSGILFCSDPGLESTDQGLLSLGGTGQSFYALGNFPEPDCRYPSTLPNGPFSIVGASALNNCGAPILPPPYYPSAITPTQITDNFGDPVHRFFQMWQQNDCAAAKMSPSDPSGCAHDLYGWVATTVGWQITQNNKPPTDPQGTFQGGVAMGFYNMAAGELPYLQSLAQSYAINDNYHQFAMGGTGPNSQAIGTGDIFVYNDSSGNPATPAADLIENPDPQPGSNNFYTNDTLAPLDPGNASIGGLINCSDSTQPGVKALRSYLASLPYQPFNGGSCDSGLYYQIDNEYPAYDTQGNPIKQGTEFPAGPNFSIGPQTIPTIGDALSAANVSWKYYGEGMAVANQPALSNELYCAICNPFQYSRSIMTGPLRNNLQDLNQFFTDVQNGTLPAVSFVKPDILIDGHPGTSTPPLFEGFAKSIVNAVMANPGIWQDTAILITFDESGGWYDSGYIQPIDFFGDGPRTVMIAVSPFAKPGYVDHTYSDHASILKLIELNWGLSPLSARSRDNLPNPSSAPAAPYFPTNSPAIGDLTGMFSF